MSETKHTPGPWNVDPSYPGDVCAGTGHDVAVTCYKGMKPIDLDGTEATIGPQSREEAEANARLIAAAPDLLESNIAFVATLSNLYGIKPEHDNDYIYDTLPSSGVAVAFLSARSAIAKATGATP